MLFNHEFKMNIYALVGRMFGGYFCAKHFNKNKIVRGMKCKDYKNCAFIKKYFFSENPVCKGLISMYCQNNINEDCERKMYVKKYGKSPSPDLLPSGQKILSDGELTE